MWNIHCITATCPQITAKRVNKNLLQEPHTSACACARGCACASYRVNQAAVYEPSCDRLQALRRKRDKTNSGFALLVFHILKAAVDVGVKCGTFLFFFVSKSFLWVHDCLRARRPILIQRQTETESVCAHGGITVFLYCRGGFFCCWQKQLQPA